MKEYSNNGRWSLGWSWMRALACFRCTRTERAMIVLMFTEICGLGRELCRGVQIMGVRSLGCSWVYDLACVRCTKTEKGDDR